MRVADRRIALVGADVGQCRAERLAPQHSFARRPQRAEIWRAGDLRTEPRDQRRISRITVDGENGLAGRDGRGFARCRPYVRADAPRRLRQSDGRRRCRRRAGCRVLQRPPAGRRRGPGRGGHGRMQPWHAVADVLVGGHQRQPGADGIDQPLHRPARDCSAKRCTSSGQSVSPAMRIRSATCCAGLSSMPAAR